MLSGGSYTNDFFEVNMPLAVAIYIPAALIAHWDGGNAAAGTTLWVFLLIAQSVALSIHGAPRGTRRDAASMAVWLSFGLAFLPGFEFGQREHIATLLFLPFVFRLTNDRPAVGIPLRIYISLLAAVGFFIKPHFAALPLVLLAADALRLRSWQPLRSVEALTLLGAGLVNTVVVLVWFPDWFVCARWASDLYGAFRTTSWRELLTGWGEPEFLGIFLVQCLITWRVPALRRSTAPFVLAAIYCLLAFLLQFKAWRYQFLPVALLLFAAQGLTLQAALAATADFRRVAAAAVWPLASLAGCLLAASVAVRAVSGLPSDSYLSRSPIGVPLDIAQKGDCVFVFSTTVWPHFPEVVNRKLCWASRYPGLWPVGGVLWREKSALSAHQQEMMDHYRREIVAAVTADLARFRPGLVLVDRRRGQMGLPDGYDLLSFFSADAAFGSQWQHYAEIGHNEAYTIYARAE
jgi:hypothetical protein